MSYVMMEPSKEVHPRAEAGTDLKTEGRDPVWLMKATFVEMGILVVKDLDTKT